jgi:hypothetical protein
VTREGIPQCEISFSICEGNALAGWTCEVEGMPVIACLACRAEWMRLGAMYPDLKPRCPRCAKGQLKDVKKTPKVVALTGLVADAVDEAMRIEGVLINVRQAVLKRLALQYGWLNGWGQAAEESAPDNGGQAGDGSAASAGRAGGEVGVLGSAVPETVGAY